jgi:hypothetical protein
VGVHKSHVQMGYHKTQGSIKALRDMFSGNGQTQAVTRAVFSAVETSLGQRKDRERALDHLDDWEEGDVHLVVCLF